MKLIQSIKYLACLLFLIPAYTQAVPIEHNGYLYDPDKNPNEFYGPNPNQAWIRLDATSSVDHTLGFNYKTRTYPVGFRGYRIATFTETMDMIRDILEYDLRSQHADTSNYVSVDNFRNLQKIAGIRASSFIFGLNNSDRLPNNLVDITRIDFMDHTHDLVNIAYETAHAVADFNTGIFVDFPHVAHERGEYGRDYVSTFGGGAGDFILVRDINEPSIILLFIAGLTGLIITRKNRYT